MSIIASLNSIEFCYTQHHINIKLEDNSGDNMNAPIVLAFVSLICGGLATFFWKIAGRNQVYSPSYMVVETLVFCGVAIGIHPVQRHPFELSNKMTLLASMGGILAAISVYTILVAFRLGGQGSVIFPIISLGIVVSVVLSFVVYREPITSSKILGLGLGASAIIALST